MAYLSRFCCLWVFFWITTISAQTALPFKDVFKPIISAEQSADNHILTIRIDVPAGYYLYRDKIQPELAAFPQARVQYGASAQIHDPYFGRVDIFDQAHPAVIQIQNPDELTPFSLHAQGCQENVICYPPETWKIDPQALAVDTDIAEAFPFFKKNTAVGAFNPITLPQNHVILKNTEENQSVSSETARVKSPSEQATAPKTVAQRLHDRYWFYLPWLILLGISLSGTACVYPMIPIVTSFVVGKNASFARGQLLITAYVLAMASTMALLGAVFGLFQINLQVVLQKPLVAAIASAIFLLLSLSLFDVLTLSAPQRMQHWVDRFSQKQTRGSFLGAIVLGALSVLVVSPCATPVLTALLLYTTQTTPFKGALALFCLGLGMGLPLFLFASVFRRFMPKAGNWMLIIKRLLALMMLAIAVWLFARILPTAYQWGLWALYLLIISTLLTAQSENASFMRLLGAKVFFALAIAATVQCVDNMDARFDEEKTGAVFQKVTTLAAIETEIKTSKQPVILDFYADWCASCRHWERTIWQNPQFASSLSAYHLLKVDMSESNADYQRILNHFSLIGPPAVLFFPAGGTINEAIYTVIGTTDAETFARALNQFADKK